MEYKYCKIEFDEKSSDLKEGEFSGMLAVFGNVDQGMDIIEKGAFSRTLSHKKNEVPLLWQHKTDEPIGLGIVTVEAKGLRILGQLNLDVQRAVEAHSLIKQKAVKGLSVGFETLKARPRKHPKGLVRSIEEAKLWEGSVATFPMNLRANIDQVKDMGYDYEDKGTSLAKRLNSLIDGMATDDKPKEKIIDDIASSAGISESTVNQILRAEIIRPPTNRLQGFAKVLKVNIDELIRLADKDAGKSMERFTYDVYALIGKCEVLKDSGHHIQDEDSLRKAVAGLNALLEQNIEANSSINDHDDDFEDIPELSDHDAETVSSVLELTKSFQNYKG